MQDSDISALDWLRREGESERVIALAECIYANDFGTSLRHLGVREMQVCALPVGGPILRSQSSESSVHSSALEQGTPASLTLSVRLWGV